MKRSLQHYSQQAKWEATRVSKNRLLAKEKYGTYIQWNIARL